MPDTYTCAKCGKVAKTKQALERHAAYHEDERPFSCEVCQQRFKNSDDRGKHYRRLKRDGKFEIACTMCHKHFKSQDLLNKHVEMLGCKLGKVEKISDDTQSLSQDTIKSESFKSDSFDDASRSNFPVDEDSLPGAGVTCSCKICETEFTGTLSLKRHYRDVHRDTKRQVCIQCGQTLSSKDSLARHFSIFHQTTFPYHCESCGQKFKIKESLCRHVKFVHQDGGYMCRECNRVFSQPVNLKKHMAVHSKQKEFKCTTCGREFRWKQALQKHEMLHESRSDTSVSYTDGAPKFEEAEHSFGEKNALSANSEEDERLDIAKTLTRLKERSLSEGNAQGRSNARNILERQNSEIHDEYEFSDLDNGSDSIMKQTRNLMTGRKRIDEFEILQYMSDAKKFRVSTVNNEEICTESDNSDYSHGTVDYPLNTSDSSQMLADETVEDSDPDFSDVGKGLENEKSDVAIELKKKQVEALTSFPTKETQDVPQLLFKPSSIQTMMAAVKVPLSSLSTDETQSRTETECTQCKTQTPWFKLPTTTIASHRPLHNPFIIPNSRIVTRLSTARPSKEKVESNQDDSTAIEMEDADENTSNASKTNQVIPCGKFSIIKHMLSLQNEENFDKKIFDNPLYNKPAKIKDFELMVERHKLAGKSDDPSTERYDLSAKQNIPFHWLGMSVQKKKVNDETENQMKSNGRKEESENITTTTTTTAAAIARVYSSLENAQKTGDMRVNNAQTDEISQDLNNLSTYLTINSKSTQQFLPSAQDGQRSVSFLAGHHHFRTADKDSGPAHVFQRRHSVLSNPFEVPKRNLIGKSPSDSVLTSFSASVNGQSSDHFEFEGNSVKSCAFNSGQESLQSRTAGPNMTPMAAAQRHLSHDSGYGSSSALSNADAVSEQKGKNEHKTSHDNKQTVTVTEHRFVYRQERTLSESHAAEKSFSHQAANFMRSYSIPAYKNENSFPTSNHLGTEEEEQIQNVTDTGRLFGTERRRSLDEFSSVSFTVPKRDIQAHSLDKNGSQQRGIALLDVYRNRNLNCAAVNVGVSQNLRSGTSNIYSHADTVGISGQEKNCHNQIELALAKNNDSLCQNQNSSQFVSVNTSLGRCLSQDNSAVNVATFTASTVGSAHLNQNMMTSSNTTAFCSALLGDDSDALGDSVKFDAYEMIDSPGGVGSLVSKNGNYKTSLQQSSILGHTEVKDTNHAAAKEVLKHKSFLSQVDISVKELLH